jgi:ubiquinone/menaquinone biosynthesis C-methylase UbiE
MTLSKAWNSKEIIKFFKSNRSTFNSLYKGEKYLLSKYINKSSTILDIGCAQGGMYGILKKKIKNINYTGVDFNRKMIALAKKKYPQVKFHHLSHINYSSFFKKKFDVVIIFGILHLNSNWKDIIKAAYKVTGNYILFDLRCVLNLNKLKDLKNYINLDFKSKSKKFQIPYIVLEKKLVLKYFKKTFKNCKIDNYNYIGKASEYSNIKSKIIFSNYCLKKNV